MSFSPQAPSRQQSQQAPTQQQTVHEKESAPVQQASVSVQSAQYRQAIAIPNLTMSSAPVDCPRCGNRKMTTISHHAGNTIHVWGAALCCITGFLCFVPYLMQSTKDVQHNCGQCGVQLATWHKSGAVDVHAHA